METIRKGNCGDAVKYLQKLLKKEYPIPVDGVFGQQTFLAVCTFQKKAGLPVDGIVGKQTWDAFMPESQSGLDFEQVAQSLGIEVAAIKAVHEVESAGRSGFLASGRPMILFEGHVFWQELKKRGVNPENYGNEYRDVLFPKWDRTSYKGGEAEYARLDKHLP